MKTFIFNYTHLKKNHWVISDLRLLGITSNDFSAEQQFSMTIEIINVDDNSIINISEIESNPEKQTLYITYAMLTGRLGQVVTYISF